MKKPIILGLFSLVLAASTALGGSINTVLVTTNHLDIPYTGTYATNHLVKLGNYSLSWHQAGKSADIIATLPTNILSGTYTLTLQGSMPVSVEIGSVTAAAALNARVDAETARAGNAETILANNINTTSNNIVASLTKNFTSAFAFGYQTVSNNVLIPFSSYIGDWTTNGTAFRVPATGVYQISFTVNITGTSPSIYTPTIQIIDSNDTGTNGLACLTYSTSGTVSGQTIVQCLQGDLISVINSGGAFSYGFNLPTNVPSATLSILQIQ